MSFFIVVNPTAVKEENTRLFYSRPTAPFARVVPFARYQCSFLREEQRLQEGLISERKSVFEPRGLIFSRKSVYSHASLSGLTFLWIPCFLGRGLVIPDDNSPRSNQVPRMVHKPPHIPVSFPAAPAPSAPLLAIFRHTNASAKMVAIGIDTTSQIIPQVVARAFHPI